MNYYMNNSSISFEVKDEHVHVTGYPELENRVGFLIGDGMAEFRGSSCELYIANTKTGRIRKFSTRPEPLFKRVLVNENEIDYDSISEKCSKEAASTARSKIINIIDLGTCYGFKNGICAISWVLRPNDGYYADEYTPILIKKDEVVYAIINTDLDIIEPFRPMTDISANYF